MSEHTRIKNSNYQLNGLLRSINLLVKPVGLEKSINVEDGLKLSIVQVVEECNSHCGGDLKDKVYNENVSWDFVCVALNILKQLKDTLMSNPKEMLSVSQQKAIKSCLEKVICLELLPNLLPGVGLGLSAHTAHADLIPQHKLSDMQKYEHICFVIDTLLDLNEDTNFHELIVSNFFGDIMAALCQLALVPFKKPQDTPGNTSDNVTKEVYKQLMENKAKYFEMLNQLASKSYQPLVIKELMIIQGNKKSPTWLKREVSKLLNTRLIQPGGVLATIRAITDASNTSTPTHSVQIAAVAKLIATPHCKQLTDENYYRVICPQILEMIDSKEADVIRIGLECCRTLSPSVLEQHILRLITKPLYQFQVPELDVTICIHRLHKCFAVPASDLWCLSIELLIPHVKILFHMYCKICQSVSHLKKFVEDLLWCILSKINEDNLNKVFNAIIFKEEYMHIKQIPDGLEFEFGDDGGLKTVHKISEHSLEEYGNSLMILFGQRDDNGKIGNALFILLLKLSTDKEQKKCIEKYIVTLKLLADLSENTKVQQAITENPKHIVSFIKSFIETNISSCNEQLEIICLSLMVLTVVLKDTMHSKKPDWTQFQDLITPLTAICDKAESFELKILAEEACTMIVTQGTLKSKNNAENTKQEEKLSKESDNCEKALIDSCDPLLPVRGHAMLKLTKLIRAKDRETIAKKEAVLCIFQENLKHEDSFLYLTAIEGLSALAAEFPDTIMMTLIDEYASTNRSQSDVRLKVGEALVRVVRTLGELVPTYKTELLNAFLAGTRDKDPLVRASSLANLGDVCQLLGYRIGAITAEILQCICCIVKTDKALEPRRAAVMVITMLLKGLAKDALFVLQDILKELYSSLKLIYNTDKDDITRLHAQLALEELNHVTREFLFPQQQLSRRIYVLDAPP